jgi:PKD repeat protein
MKKLLLSLFVSILTLGLATAQTNRCGTMEYHEILKAQDPGYEARHAAIEELVTRKISADKTWRTTGTISIPVVFHILYSTNNATQNISNARINAQMAVLNADYSATNTDIGNVPSVFTSAIGNANIQFCLAVRDPQGNTTDGIIRKQTSTTSFSISNNGIKFDSMGGDDAWPSTDYLNIWVGNLGNGLLGYAQFPGGPANTDGVVLLNECVGGPGAPGTLTPYHLGRSASHEIGHWLDLKHIWGDDNGACSGSDLVADTPNQAAENYGCPSFPQISCSNGPNGEMYMNYMDYTDDACMMMFTNGQCTRMNSTLSNARASIQNSQGCVPVTAGAPVANFTASSTNILVGGSVNFTDQSAGNPTTWDWVFSGGTPGNSNSQNPSNIVYNAPGTYTVTLTVTNLNGTDTETKTNYITVSQGGGTGCDTLTNLPDPYTPTIFTSSTGGYCAGHNGYLDVAKAEKHLLPSIINPTIVGVLVKFAVATASGPSSTFDVTIWNDGGTGNSPGTELGSVQLNYSAAEADAAAGIATFADFSQSPVPISSDFFAGIEFGYTPGDTLAVETCNDGEVSPATAWEQFNTLDWYAFDNTSSWGLALGMSILPIVCEGVGINEPIQDGIVIYPNPTSGQVMLHNTNKSVEGASVKVINMMGQTVINNFIEDFSGTHYLDLSSFDSGMYFVEVLSDNSHMKYKLVLNK